LLNGLTERSHTDPAALTEAGSLFLQLQEDKAGVEWLLRALRQDPQYVPAHEALVRYYESKGQSDKAAEHKQALSRLRAERPPH
jgi:Tfp pilus assembly protein PilF